MDHFVSQKSFPLTLILYIYIYENLFLSCIFSSTATYFLFKKNLCMPYLIHYKIKPTKKFRVNTKVFCKVTDKLAKACKHVDCA